MDEYIASVMFLHI